MNECDSEISDSSKVSSQDIFNEFPDETLVSSNHEMKTTKRDCKNSKKEKSTDGSKSQNDDGLAKEPDTSESSRDNYSSDESRLKTDENFAKETRIMALSLNKGEISKFVKLTSNYIKERGHRGILELHRLFNDDLDTNLNTTDADGNTALHLAAQQNEPDVIDFLLSQPEIDKNACNNNDDTPIAVAARKGYYNIFRKLLDHESTSLGAGAGNKTELHLLVKGIMQPQRSDNSIDEKCDHRKCLEYVLDKLPKEVKDPKNFVNLLDSKGKTALHYAVKAKDNDATLRLLKAGSYMNHEAKKGGIILRDINKEVLMEYLDSCVSMNTSKKKICQHQLILDCEIFDGRNRDGLKLAELMMALNDEPKLRTILTHPVVQAYLSFQWHDKQKYYLMYLFFFVWLYFLLILYLIMPDSCCQSKILFECTSNDCCKLLFVGFPCVIFFIQWIYSIIFRSKSVKSLENMVKLSLAGVTFHLLVFYDETGSNINSPILAILLLFGDIMLLLGIHPMLSTYTEIFKVVVLNFSKFIFSYCTIILAYACCLCVVKKQNSLQEKHMNQTISTNHTINRFNITLSLIDAFAVLTGSIDKPGSDQLDIRHFLYVSSIFLLTIVLSNLLSGLAVNDIHVIKKNADLYGILSQMNFILFLENNSFEKFLHFAKTLYSRIRNNWKNRRQCCKLNWTRIRSKFIGTKKSKPIERKESAEEMIIEQETAGTGKDHKKIFANPLVILQNNVIHSFENSFPDNKIYILPNDRNSVFSAVSADQNKAKCYKRVFWKVDPNVVENALKIVKKQENPDIDHAELLRKQMQELKEINRKMKLMEKIANKIKKC